LALSIRTRLTAWYTCTLLVSLLAFSGILYAALRAAMQASIDVELQSRLAGVKGYMYTQVPRFPRARLWHEFAENVQMQPGGEMMQVSDASGWIFQSESIRGLALPAPASPHFTPLTTEVIRGIPLRVLIATITIGFNTYSIQVVTDLRRSYETSAEILRIALWLAPLLLVASATGGYWLSSRALAPVDRMIESSRQISFTNLHRRLVVPRTGDELQRLSETLNQMIQRLETAYLSVVQFTGDASHELRTPVAFIRTTAEVALVQPRTPESYRSALSAIHEESERITEIIEQLLILARADADRYALNLVQIDVREPVSHALSKILPLAAEKGVKLHAELPEDEAAVFGDAASLLRLFLILLDNALKYTPEGGAVTVRISNDAGRISVAVRDSGIGIAESELDKIFDRFYQADKARSRDSGGSGLGLSIGRWIAEAHRAEIRVESKLHVGSQFTVWFLQPILHDAGDERSSEVSLRT
jgi:heavy metal sensor kinase